MICIWQNSANLSQIAAIAIKIYKFRNYSNTMQNSAKIDINLNTAKIAMKLF